MLMDLKNRKAVENEQEKKRMDEIIEAEQSRKRNEYVDRLRSQQEYHLELSRQEQAKRMARVREKVEDKTMAEIEYKNNE